MIRYPAGNFSAGGKAHHPNLLRVQLPCVRFLPDRLHRQQSILDRGLHARFTVGERLGRRTLLEVRLETGRTHQIRVHLEAIGLPVSGDPVYGVAGDLDLGRQFLHAHRLRFTHPLTGEDLDLSAPLPVDLEAALDRARTA